LPLHEQQSLVQTLGKLARMMDAQSIDAAPMLDIADAAPGILA